MHKKHQKPEFEVISIDKENAKFFAGSDPKFGFFVPTTNMQPLGTPPTLTTTGVSVGPHATNMDDGGTIDFN